MSITSTPYYKALDILLIYMACALAYWIRFNDLLLPLPYFLTSTVLVITSAFCLSITSFYRNINSGLSSKQIIAALSGMIFAGMITAACLYLTKSGEQYSRVWFALSISLSLILFLLVRHVLGRVFQISMGGRCAILIGGKKAKHIYKTLSLADKKNIDILSLCELDGIEKIDLSRELEKASAFIEETREDTHIKNGVSEVWVTSEVFQRIPHHQLEDIFSDSSARLVYIPDLPDIPFSRAEDIEMVMGIPTINSDITKKRKLNNLFKMLEDQMISWLSIILLAPVLIIISIAIKLDSKGPIFFKQVRYGFSGKNFNIWKFRTMSESESTQTFKQASKNDPRVTKVGRFLRKTSLDELPQLINVINGSMSLVGPRPHPKKLNEDSRNLINSYMQRHSVKPGITGLAQINGFRGETSEIRLMEMRVKYDLEYVQTWSIRLDLKIIGMTFVHLISGENAY